MPLAAQKLILIKKVNYYNSKSEPKSSPHFYKKTYAKYIYFQKSMC